ncbi:hydrogenase formation protein HypD [Inediibacterium massiliense]|uniref:hydrogenase formation protein HypD n=1 Tax=Inediibacterium massiliense TaxID=1658111 RepID=UPI0006B574F2|nr:hydrogenase formation protein HypD [Inediibacterium massiliense]
MDKKLIKYLVNEINKMAQKEIKIMEVCGTHTQMISKLGIRSLLSPRIKLLSGPGCPVCVTDEKYIDTAIEMLNNYDVTIATFGDLLRVKGTKNCLLDEKSKGKNVMIIHSPLDLIEMAKDHKEKEIIFLGVGFETTAPIIALAIKTAFEKSIDNLFFLTSIKLMPPILHHILKQPKSQIQGLICPGHVASIKGASYFKFIVDDYNVPATVCGFEALDILGCIYYLVKQISNNEKRHFENLYKRCVKHQGNPVANGLLEEVFQVSHGQWRGIGEVENSFLTIQKKYEDLDAEKNFIVKIKSQKHITKCVCSDILLGNKTPRECELFHRGCNPLTPHGPCMVSTEGACAIAYRYREEV